MSVYCPIIRAEETSTRIGHLDAEVVTTEVDRGDPDGVIVTYVKHVKKICLHMRFLGTFCKKCADWWNP